jgi:PrtD family type I secretion system ABC transporter
MKSSRRSELAAALASCRGAFIGLALVSAVINVLYLTGSFFMLEVYDRVLPSRSIPTLVGLALLAAGLYAFQGILDFVRSRVLVRVGSVLDEKLSARTYEAIVRLPLAGRGGDGIQAMRDLDQVRTFLSSTGPSALFDLPWLPFYVGICFLFHPWIGIAAALGALALVTVTILTEVLTRAPTREAVVHGMARAALAEASRRNAEVLQAMGMARRLHGRWSEANDRHLASHRTASDVAGGLGALSKVLRMMIQSAVLGLGAYLVVHGQATAGIIIAGAILSARALAPVELAIANWRGFVAARQGWRRLDDLLNALPPVEEPMELPRPAAELAVEGVSVMPPGLNRFVAQDVAFALRAGQGLGIIGPSASGKSSLARALVGVWRPVRGKVRLDGAALEQWSPEALGRHVGYLPQDVELFAGTVADNIARFEEEPNPEAVIAAARAAGVHDLVLRLADGYETRIGEGGAGLSAGQCQRVALARALYKDPFLVVLDEPNSNLDSEGEEALTQAILGVRARGGIVVVIAHRPSALAGVDRVLMMVDGRQQAFGPKEEVLSKVLRRPAAAPVPAQPAAASTAFGGLPGLRIVEGQGQGA